MLLLMTMLESNLSRVRLFLSRLWRRCRGGQLFFSNVVLLWRRLKTIFSNTRSFKMSLWLWIGDGVPSHSCGTRCSEHHTRKESSGCRSLEKSFRPAGARPSSSWHWCRRGGSPLCSSPPWTASSTRGRTSTMFVINPRIEMTWQDNVCEDRKDMTNSTMFAITVATVRNALIVSSHLGVKKIRLQAIFRWKRSVFEVAVKITCLFIHSS